MPTQRGALPLALVILVAIFIIGSAGAVVYYTQQGDDDNSVTTNTSQVSNFDECAAASGVVQETHPRRCAYQGYTYTENVNTAVNPGVAATNVTTDVVASVNAVINKNVNISVIADATNLSANITDAQTNAVQNSNSANTAAQTIASETTTGTGAVTLVAIGDAYVFTDIETTFTLKGFDANEKTADLDISYSKGLEAHWQESDPGPTGYVPNPSTYAQDIGTDLLAYATVLYRSHYYCDGTLFTGAQPVGAYEKIDLASGYANFICRNRKQEQCVTDGTFEHYYDERCDYGTVAFVEGLTKSAPNFSITVNSVASDGVEITVIPLD